MDRIVERMIELVGEDYITLIISGNPTGKVQVIGVYPDDGHAKVKTEFGVTLLIRTDRIDCLMELPNGKSPQV